MSCMIKRARNFFPAILRISSYLSSSLQYYMLTLAHTVPQSSLIGRGEEVLATCSQHCNCFNIVALRLVWVGCHKTVNLGTLLLWPEWPCFALDSFSFPLLSQHNHVCCHLEHKLYSLFFPNWLSCLYKFPCLPIFKMCRDPATQRGEWWV